MSQLNKSVELMKGRSSTGRASHRPVVNSRNKENPVVDISNKPTALGSMTSTPSNIDIFNMKSSRFIPIGVVSSRSFDKSSLPVKKTGHNLFMKQTTSSRCKINNNV